MQTLRRARWITRLVLVWFALFIGAAVASPMVKPQGSAMGQMVCTAIGDMKLVSLYADTEGRPTELLGMDCPLCMPVASPALAIRPAPHPLGLNYALHTLESTLRGSLIGPPWQARGPPTPAL